MPQRSYRILHHRQMKCNIRRFILQLLLCRRESTTTFGYVCGMKTSFPLWNSDQTTQSREQDSGDSFPPQDESFDDGTEDGEVQLRHEILEASLPFVHSYGWSQDAIAQGAETLGYSSMAHGMFSGGGVELVNHFYSMCNIRLEESLKAKVKEIEENPEKKKGTTDFIANAVEERLRMNIEYIDSWHRALALHASPRNAAEALHNIGTLVDHIWYHAGDRSYDFNWYTKRGILTAVYKSSELCMLQDKSEDFQDTWAFLNRRLSDVHRIAKCASGVNSFTKDFSNIAKAGILTAFNIMGMNICRVYQLFQLECIECQVVHLRDTRTVSNTLQKSPQQN